VPAPLSEEALPRTIVVLKDCALLRLAAIFRPAFGRLVAPVLAFGVAVVFTVLALAVFPGAAAAEDDLIIDSETVFLPEPETGRLLVEHSFDLLNDRPQLVREEEVEDFFFTSFAFYLLADAQDLTVTTPLFGRNIALEVERVAVEGSPGIQVATVKLADRLGFEERSRIEVTYVVQSGEARSDDPVRITDSYIAFPVYACCDPGRTKLRIEVPLRFSLDVKGDDTEFEFDQTEDTRILTRSDIDEPTMFNAFIFGRDDAELTVSSVEIDGDRIQIEAWPDDHEWASFVRDAVLEFVPRLEDEIDLPWPQGDELRIVETTTPYLFGYAGWYRHQDDVIEVGESLDEAILAHELTHAWFSDELFNSRWINEGLAEFFTGQVMGVPQLQKPQRSSFFAQPLSEWTRPTGVSSPFQDSREQYGYAASRLVIETVVDEIGRDGLGAVLDANSSGEISFRAGDLVETDAEAWRSWQRFMDLVQERGGWEDVDELFEEWVATPEQAATITVRRETHRLFDEFEQETVAWPAPVGLRSALTLWSFDEAVSLMAFARPVYAAGAELGRESVRLDLPVPDRIQNAYAASTSAEDFANVEMLIEQQRVTLSEITEIAALVEAPRSVLDRLGLRGTDQVAQMDKLRAAYVVDDTDRMNEIAAEIRATNDNARSDGLRTLVIAGLALLVFLSLASLWIGSKRGSGPGRRTGPQGEAVRWSGG